MQKYSSVLINRLFTNIDADDELNPAVRLPAGADFSCTESERRDCYRLSLQMLEDYVIRGAFRALIAAIIRQKSADAAQIAAFRKARSCFKQMRYACANFDARHHYPRALHNLTALMGDFQDAVINGQKFKLTWLGLRLWLRLAAAPYRRLMRGLENYQPDSEEKYQKYLGRENKNLAKYLKRSPLRGTGAELHSLRKIISRRTSLNDTLRALRPSADADKTALWLATLNGMLGDIHDELVSESLAGKRRYKRDIFTPPATIEERCRLFLDRQTGRQADRQTGRQADRLDSKT